MATEDKNSHEIYADASHKSDSVEFKRFNLINIHNWSFGITNRSLRMLSWIFALTRIFGNICDGNQLNATYCHYIYIALQDMSNEFVIQN